MPEPRVYTRYDGSIAECAAAFGVNEEAVHRRHYPRPCSGSTCMMSPC